VQNLALTSNALLAIIPFGADEPLIGLVRDQQRKLARVIHPLSCPDPMTSQAKCPEHQLLKSNLFLLMPND